MELYTLLHDPQWVVHTLLFASMWAAAMTISLKRDRCIRYASEAANCSMKRYQELLRNELYAKSLVIQAVQNFKRRLVFSGSRCASIVRAMLSDEKARAFESLDMLMERYVQAVRAGDARRLQVLKTQLKRAVSLATFCANRWDISSQDRDKLVSWARDTTQWMEMTLYFAHYIRK